MLIVQPSHCQQLYFPLKYYAGLSDTRNISYLCYLCLVFETQVVFLFTLVFCGVVWRLLGSPSVTMRCFCQARIFVSLFFLLRCVTLLWWWFIDGLQKERKRQCQRLNKNRTDLNQQNYCRKCGRGFGSRNTTLDPLLKPHTPNHYTCDL